MMVGVPDGLGVEVAFVGARRAGAERDDGRSTSTSNPAGWSEDEVEFGPAPGRSRVRRLRSWGWTWWLWMKAVFFILALTKNKRRKGSSRFPYLVLQNGFRLGYGTRASRIIPWDRGT